MRVLPLARIALVETPALSDADAIVMELPARGAIRWKRSRYTHTIEIEGGGLLYNGRTGALVELSAGAFATARHALDAGLGSAGSLQDFSEGSLAAHLAAGGFVVRDDVDELAILETQYEQERQRSQFLLTILPTFGCNLGCEYCFVGKKKGGMSHETQERLVAFAARRLTEHTVPSMNVDWFGGEPLLAPHVIEYLSAQFQTFCASAGVPYRAQVITNGTVITPRIAKILHAAGVDRLQITLDGPATIHDARRPYKSGTHSSFAATIDSLQYVVGDFVIRLRINVDVRNIDHVWPLLDLFAERGWLGAETQFYPYLARISPFTEACASVAGHVCSM